MVTINLWYIRDTKAKSTNTTEAHAGSEGSADSTQGQDADYHAY
jgi:hypothetical protein